MGTARKFSRKREAILAAISSTKSHPSADWLYKTLKSDLPDISLGTIYRNLSLFRENGDIVCVGSVNGQERYDADTAPHSHFICRQCGAVEDVPAGQAVRYPDIDAKIEGHQLNFYGLCKKCRGSEAH